MEMFLLQMLLLALEDIEDKSLLNENDLDYQVTLGIRAVR